MMQPTLEQITASLEQVRARPGMFLGRENYQSAICFLTGFTEALKIAGVNCYQEQRWEAQQARGWQVRNIGPVNQMIEKGLNYNAIISELISIELETLRRSNDIP